MFDTERLTPEQRAAATHSAGHLLIVAGAGTGKTTTLTARLAHLIRSGTPPERILMLTFSRRAAAELLNRAEQMTGESTASSWGGTFHAVANRLLRRHGRAIGLEPSFTVLDQTDTADLLALVRNEHETPSEGTEAPYRRRARKQTLAEILSRCVNTGSPLSQVLRTHFPWCADERAEIRATFEAYTARKRERQVLDFDDLLLFWGALLKVPDVARLLQSQFDHILVDEYQDTNPLQADLLEAMAGGGATLTAVGDDAQSIYSFRAASHRNIMEFPARFGAEVAMLEQNHRSTPSLVKATNAVIAEAALRHPKELWSARQERGRPVLVRCDDESDQSRQVCDRLLHHYERGTKLQGQAVLVRAAHHSALLEMELTARKIPFVKYGGLKFLEAAHVKDLVCLLRLVENPRDELAWFRVLQLVEGVGPGAARRITAGLVNDRAPVAALGGAAASLGEEPQAVLRSLAEALTESAGQGPESAGAAVERARQWLDPVVAARYPNSGARLADLNQLGQMAAGRQSLRQFLADLTLDPPSSTSDLAGPPHLDDDFVTISTIHSAKGCEWDVVHLIHVTDGHIPSDLATGDAEAIEEERRLLYVAMTRARNHLYAYSPLRYHFRPAGRDDGHGYGQLTRFFTPGVLACLDSTQRSRPASRDPDGLVVEGAEVSGIAAVDRMVAALWD
jgi:DNA helicase-2/ATP-dependent DNA helicase PcrA